MYVFSDAAVSNSPNIETCLVIDWMNDLQSLPEKEHGTILVTLNPPFEPETVIGRFGYDHPVLDAQVSNLSYRGWPALLTPFAGAPLANLDAAYPKYPEYLLCRRLPQVRIPRGRVHLRPACRCLQPAPPPPGHAVRYTRPRPQLGRRLAGAGVRLARGKWSEDAGGLGYGMGAMVVSDYSWPRGRLTAP
jgi:hypothetical protein